ncbi:hypothetical protein NC652_017022 [Populus alba x Populus x berolinensis]|nr:hypothetical protein NC652_017022 [Populus alba x Populus x berolinensis]
MIHSCGSSLLTELVQAVNICHAIEDGRKFLLGITWKKLETAKIISVGDSLQRLDCIKCFLPVRGPPESFQKVNYLNFLPALRGPFLLALMAPSPAAELLAENYYAYVLDGL